MSKQNKTYKPCNKQPTTVPVETGRGIIRDNFLAAIVTSRVFQPQVVKAKKGKGSYKRHKGI